MKKIVTYIFILIACAVPAQLSAQTLSSVPGSFVDIGFGARLVGMGFAYVGLANDEYAGYWNPAGLTQLKQYGISFTHTNQLQLVPYDFFSGAAPLKEFGNFKQSVGLTVISSGDLALNEVSIHANYAIAYKSLSLGVGLKYRYASFGNNVLNADDYVVFDPNEITTGFNQQVSGNAQGFGLDIGLLYTPYKRLQIGVLLRDVYAPVTWNGQTKDATFQSRGEYQESLPFEVITGFAFRISKSLTFTTDTQLALNSDRSNFVRLGTEARLLEFAGFEFLIRGGTEQTVNSIHDEKYAGGLGLIIPIKKLRVQADYAYLIQDLANSHRISLSIRF